MNSGHTLLVRTLAHPWDTRSPARCRVRVEWESVLLDPQPSLPTLRQPGSVVVRMVHRYYAAVWLLADVHGPCGLSLHPPTCGLVSTAGVSEVSRFSCMKFLGVPGVFDYAGPNKNSR